MKKYYSYNIYVDGSVRGCGIEAVWRWQTPLYARECALKAARENFGHGGFSIADFKLIG